MSGDGCSYVATSAQARPISTLRMAEAISGTSPRRVIAASFTFGEPLAGNRPGSRPNSPTLRQAAYAVFSGCCSSGVAARPEPPRDHCTARMPPAMIATPSKSSGASRSPRRKAPVDTPMTGFRKWKVAARTAPIRPTRRNQTQVASNPGTRVVKAKARPSRGVLRSSLDDHVDG